MRSTRRSLKPDQVEHAEATSRVLQPVFRLDCLQQVTLFYTLMSWEFKRVLIVCL